MTDEPEEGFNPAKFFEMLRKSASVKAGAIMFGQAQIAYYDTLKQHMSEEMAYNMLAHTTEVMIKSILAAAPSTLKVILETAMAWEGIQQMINPEMGGKEVPGSGSSPE